MKKISVIGAGLSGLISAWYIKEFHPEAEVTIFEADKAGGQISSEEYEGVILEKGPAYLTLENPVLHYALSKCGSSDLQLCNAEKSYVLKESYYQKAPGGFMEFEHGRLSFLSGGIFSIFGLKKKAAIWDNVSFYDFLKSTYGLTYAETFGSMFARNIFYCEAENLNFRAAYSELYDQLKKGQSLKESLQTFAKQKEDYWQSELKQNFVPGIYYFKDGLGKLIDILTDDLKKKNCHIEYAKIHDITEQKGEYLLHSKHSKYGPFQNIISTAGAHDQAVYWKSLNKDLSQQLSELKYSSVSYVYSNYNFKDFNRAGLGFLASRKEKLTVSGATYMNALNKNIEKNQQFLARTIIPGDLSLFKDDELVEMQVNDFEKVFGLTIKPLWSRVYRNEGPLLDTHYTAWKNSIKDAIKDLPSLSIIGKDMSGADISQILQEAYKTAKNL